MTFSLCHEPGGGFSSTTLGGETRNDWSDLLSRKRLRRLMCGKPPAFRLLTKVFPRDGEAEPRHLVSEREDLPERQSLSAHRAAKPLKNELSKLMTFCDATHNPVPQQPTSASEPARAVRL
jgi:hypothetical protein